MAEPAAGGLHFGISTPKRRLIVGITGATGVEIGVRLLAVLQERPDVETHLVMTKWARATLQIESDYSPRDVIGMADYHYAQADQAAPISSGSFSVDGMAIVPCSMKTLAGIRVGYGSDLIGRAADVTLKERRQLVLVPRETPLSPVHLENMLELSRLGVTILPPMPAFYNRPKGISDVIDHTVMRILDQFGIDAGIGSRWSGVPHADGNGSEALHGVIR
ncbi:UbiX family flavin prenyltransferase [Streptomyces sp. NPDC023998]|uniref:UbiX family flavin prenyltransferase n=1 Tax=Streptomyces sp. NPDC023998 TaxID=3154597 RepID=UPI0033DD0AFC